MVGVKKGKTALIGAVALAFVNVSAYDFVPGVVPIPEGSASSSPAKNPRALK